ncbi:MAG: DNA adenine methylase [Planctomycetes bacterium]|nr:DNA adenine methylase [Planctomycetota bacterium]
MPTSPIIWFGGKSALADRIIQVFPAHRTYVEPFGGSAAVLLAKAPAPVEVYNDVDAGLVNLFRVIRSPLLMARLQAALKMTPYSRAEFNAAKEPADDPVEAARRFMIRQRQSYSGVNRVWGFVVDDHGGRASNIGRWRRGFEVLPEVCRRLLDVQIEQDDWRVVLRRYDRLDTLFYLDPPYVWETRQDGKYAHELSLQDHAELVAALLALKGKAILSGYWHESYSPLEAAGWQRLQWDVPCMVKPGTKSRRTECLWLSPRAQRMDRGLFGMVTS